MAPISVTKGAAKARYGWVPRLGRRSPSARVYASELHVRRTGDFDFMNAAIPASAGPRGCASNPKLPLSRASWQVGRGWSVRRATRPFAHGVNVQLNRIAG